jgi:hypothetical protein
MKSKALLALAITLLVGCTSTRFVEFRGQGVFEGKGGSVRNVKGIDIWDIGEPDRKFEIIGFIQQEMIQNNANLLARAINNSISEAALVAEAKKRGGDAIIFISSASQIAGAHTSDSGTASTVGPFTTFHGDAHTSVYTLFQARVAVVRYVK